jgi:hypothetical protein
MYRIEIHHTIAIDKVPVEVLDARIDEWRAFPVWKRILRRPPLVRIGKKLTVDIEPIDGEYETIEAASEAAQALAKAHDGKVRPDTTVMVVRVEGGPPIGGWYPGDRGRC